MLLGLNADPDAALSTDAARAALATAVQHLVGQPPATRAPGLLLVLAFPAVPVHPRVGAVRRDPGTVHPVGRRQGVRGRPEPGPVATSIKAIYAAMATGFVSNSGVEAIDACSPGAGWPACSPRSGSSWVRSPSRRSWSTPASSQRLLEPIVRPARRRGPLILAVNSSGIGLNVIAGDQYVADVLPARMFRGEFAERGLAPQVLSRAVEDSGTVTSVLVPGIPAAPTSRACSASPPPPTSRSASSTCSARCWTCCTGSSGSRCPGRPPTGRTLVAQPAPPVALNWQNSPTEEHP